ncbi:MAG TPA: CHASE3 domain-containing protein, partial [Polyangiaceae bacterium]|nr:CHASE3 domain-containing protein [Polyangiaceae bacterium]
MWTYGKRLALGFALSFVTLAAVGIVAYRSIQTLTETSTSVAHAHTVLEHIVNVLSAMKDAETGQRGYVITGDEAFLEPYRPAEATIAAKMAELRQLTADNPRQMQRLDQAEPLIHGKFVELARVIEERRTGGFEPASKTVAEGKGKRFMDEIRAVFTDMDHEERGLLAERAAEASGSAAGARSTIIGGTLLGLLL